MLLPPIRTERSGLRANCVNSAGEVFSSSRHNVMNQINSCVCQGSTFKSSTPSSAPSSAPSISARPSTVAESDGCVDDPDWLFDNENGLGCAHLTGINAASVCESVSNVIFKGKAADIAW